MAAQAGEFLPVLSAVGRAEDGGIFDSGVNRVGIGERWFQMPHALEFPGMLCSVVPLMRGQRLRSRVVGEFVALAFRRTRCGRFPSGFSRLMPSFAAVVRTLNQLSKPAARLRRVNAIGISGRSFEVIHFPACKMRAANIPFFALAVRGQNERALACAY